VLIADLARDALTRWPAYAPAAREHGVQAVFAFPLQIGAARLGTLDDPGQGGGTTAVVRGPP
jgi:hypothetical protein